MEEAVAFSCDEATAASDARCATPDKEPEAAASAPRGGPAAPEDADEKKIVEIRITLDARDGALLKILSALEPRHPFPAPALAQKPDLPAPVHDDALAPEKRTPSRRDRPLVSPLALLAALLLGFTLRMQVKDIGVSTPAPSAASLESVIDQIVASESHSDPAARNPYSSALGVGQFVEATWLGLVRKHRPDLAATLTERQILDLRKDPELSRHMTSRYAEENKSLLARRGLPVTPGALYLAHFAGPAGAAAILTAPGDADAASVIANVDARPGITREKIVTGNPFMKNFTAKDLKNWADLKMQGLSLVAGDRQEKSDLARD